jgi:thiosulfate/3-mercaptopyruvate sulfurtransferase
MYGTLIDVQTLAAHLDDPDWVVIDCRYDLTDPDRGRGAYCAGHIPGALYADLGRDLSGPPHTDRGRHPLPAPSALAATFSRLGIAAGVQVVAYDAAGGTIAARLWWLLRYLGHDRVAVLDGGLPAWQEAGLAIRAGVESRPAREFHGEPRRDRLVTLDAVAGAAMLIDARDPVRYRGEQEPLDPVAGHIPGARNYFCKLNLAADGRFLPAGEIRMQLLEVLRGATPGSAVFYCGSGVTACHDLLALAHAGLGEGRLYAGSWSEWCRTPGNPVAVGPEPGPPLAPTSTAPGPDRQ